MSTSDVSAGDIVAILSGLASIYFGWQQNRIFKQQNKIFAAQAGVEMPEQVRPSILATYWPTLAAALAAVSVGFALIRFEPVSVALPWSLAALLAFGVTLSTLELRRALKSQRAAIAESREISHEQRGRINALAEQLEQLRGESLSISVNGKLVAGPAAFDEHRKLQAQSDLLSPLQLEALAIAKDLRDFLAGMPPFPIDPALNPEDDNAEYMVRLIKFRSDKQMPWRQKLAHGYANRRFGERITALMHRAGEEVEYPVYVPNFAEKQPFGEDDIRKLAQQMEMVAIWINRKERGEVDLLHPKP